MERDSGSHKLYTLFVAGLYCITRHTVKNGKFQKCSFTNFDFFCSKTGTFVVFIDAALQEQNGVYRNTIFCLQLSNVIVTQQYLSVSAVTSMAHPSLAGGGGGGAGQKKKIKFSFKFLSGL